MCHILNKSKNHFMYSTLSKFILVTYILIFLFSQYLNYYNNFVLKDFKILDLEHHQIDEDTNINNRNDRL